MEDIYGNMLTISMESRLEHTSEKKLEDSSHLNTCGKESADIREKQSGRQRRPPVLAEAFGGKLWEIVWKTLVGNTLGST